MMRHSTTPVDAAESGNQRRKRRSRTRAAQPHHRLLTAVTAVGVSIALILTGVGTPAFAETTPSPTPSAPTESAEATPSAPATPPEAETETAAPEPAEATASPSPVATDDPSDPDAADTSDGADSPETAAPEPLVDDETSPAAAEAVVTPQLVPDPGVTTSVITVKVGADRTGITGVTPLAGVVLHLNNGTDASDGVRPDGVAGDGDGWARCVSDADGDCSFIVPETQVGGANRNARYWVVQESVPAGWYGNPDLRVGSAFGQGTVLPYEFRTGELLQAGEVYSSQDANDFMLASGNVPNASQGIWQQSRVNPPLGPGCGLDVALILDLSGSVADSGLDELKQAADTFVDSLQGTTSTMALFSFSANSPASGATGNFPDLVPVTTPEQGSEFKSRYAGWTAGGGTNWDRGLGTAAAANTPSNNFDLSVIITDGSPTLYNSPPSGNSSNNRFREVENGIYSANALKSTPGVAGTRILAFGVGSAALGFSNSRNLRAISGEIAFDGTNGDTADYYQTLEYEEAGTALRNLALGNCQGSLTVTKQIVPNGAPAGSIDGATPAGPGWQFDSVVGTPGVTPASDSQTTTDDGTGSVQFSLDYPGGTPSASVTVTETQQAGYTLQPVDGQNAVCTNLNTGEDVALTGNPTDGFTVDVPRTQAVNCVVYNRAPVPVADLTVTKSWVINGVTYENGAQPSDFQAELQLTGPGDAGATPQGWGVTRPGYVVGDTVTISETVTVVDSELCSTTAVVTSVNETPVNEPVADGYEITLTQSSNTAQITNTVECESRLTLVKQVELGNASPTEWTLSAENTTGAPIVGFDGVSGSADVTDVEVTPNARYQLFEDDPNALYVQTDNRTTLETNPLSTGSATCIRVNADGTPFAGSGYSDGINGAVGVPLGYRVSCTLVNQTSRLRLLKSVVNDDGGTLSPADWQLTATPAARDGLTATTVPGTNAVPVDANPAFLVRPDQVYTLSESDEPGYEFVRLEQYIGTTWSDVVANPDPDGYPRQDADGNWQITVGALRTGVYRFVNDDVAPTLTLVKQVVNDDGGTAAPEAWTLTATTPAGPNLSGTTGTDAVTAVPVESGVVYTIGETGPAGYDWSDLSCTGHPETTTASPTLTLELDEDVTCTLVNDDVLIPVTVEKSDGAVEQRADGTWQITYQVQVSNPNPTLPTTYTLTDTPDFDASFEILSEGWVVAPGADVPIEAGGVDTYTYVVTARTVTTPVDPSALECSPDDGGGFFNLATVTFPGGEATDTGCAVPGSPVVQKTALPSTQDTATGEWTVAYQVAVSNPTTIALSYELSDDAGPLPAGVTGGPSAASDPVAQGGGTFDRNEAWAGAGLLATGTLPAGAVHTYTVTRVVTVAPTATDEATECSTVVNQGGGVWNTATVTNGIADETSSDCAEIDRPGVTIDKTVTSTTQLVDGTWQITYDVVVTNQSESLAAVYDLDDTLQFGGDIVIEDASWAGPTGTGSFSGDAATLATARVLAPAVAGAGVDVYTVTVRADVPEGAFDGDTLVCEDGEEPGAGGFLNVATVTANGVETDADDCSEPALPTIQKSGVSAVQSESDPDTWLVSYDVVVTSGGFPTFYSLSDTPAFASGITVVSGSAQRTDIPAQPVVAITSGEDFVTDAPLGAGATQVYRVSWTVEVTDAFTEDDATCTGEPGQGFFNTAELTVGDIPIDSDACIPVADRVYPTITKSVTSTNQDPGTGDWTITYDLVVTLAPEGPANPDGLSASYDLTDTLDFGGDIAIGSAQWSGQSSGTFTDPDEPAALATDTAIAAGTTHTYTVTVVAEVTVAAIDDGTTECDSDENGGGGFLNTALLTSGGQETPVDACSEPVFPLIEKVPGDYVQNPDGSQTIGYAVTVTYPDTGADPAAGVGYVLTDTPELPDGVVLEGEWTAAAADDQTPLPDQATFDGTGTWTIVTADFTPEDVAAGETVHTFLISGTVRVPAAPVAEPETCDELESEGILVLNTATVTSGDYVADDDACQLVYFDDVGIVKTTDAAAPVESGEEFDYVLTITNYGDRPAVDVQVSDPVPSRLTVTAIDLSGAPGWANDNAPALVGPGNTVALSTATMAVGASVTVILSVSVNPVPVPVVPRLEEGDPVPTPTLPETVLRNEACVTADLDGNPSNNCDEVTIETQDIAAVVYTRCVGDAPFVGFSLIKTANLASEPVNLNWVPLTAQPDTTPASVVREYPGGATAYADEFAWVGTAFTPSGVSIDYPGWRPLQAADYYPGGGYYLPGTTDRMTPEQQAQFVFNGLILDPSELDYSWREPTTLTLSVNPSLAFAVQYPPASPTCFVARSTEVQVEKTASVVQTDPGGAFTYTIATENVSDDSAADGVVITDTIPATLRITGVSWVGADDPATFPNWQSCAVTGQGSGGYGGTLTCVLFGPLQPAGAGLGTSSAPTITLAASVAPTASVGIVTNVAVVDYYTFGNPSDVGRDSDDAIVLLSTLPATGGGAVGTAVSIGLLALIAALALLVFGRRRGEARG